MMARPASRFPTELELQILKILWRSGPASVREIRESLVEDAQRELAHTTVVTVLHTMTDKGLLGREQHGKAYTFSARVSEASVSKGMLDDLLNRVFDGSAEALLLNLLDLEYVDDDEHRALRRLINRRRRQGE
jgi:predicted transcriptional regulator